MDLRFIDRAIGTGIVIIVLYHLVGIILPILIWGVIGLAILRLYLTYINHKK